MDIEKMRLTLEQRQGELKSYLGKDEWTDEDRAKIDELTADCERLNGDIGRAEKAEAEKRAAETPVDDAIKPDVERRAAVTAGPDREVRFGQFLQLVARSRKNMATGRGGPEARLLEHQAAVEKRLTGAGETIPSDGGFLVGTDDSNELIRRAYDMSQLYSRVRKIPIGAGSNGISIPYIDETSRATGSRLGGVQVYRVAEGGTATAKNPTFGRIKMDLIKLMGYGAVSDELLEDAAALGSLMGDSFAEEMAFVLDDEVFRGSGAGKMLGIITAACKVEADAETGQDADTIVAENIINMWARFFGRCRPNGVWLYNQACEPQLYTMTINVGTGGIPVYMPANGLSGSPYGTLMGRPAIPIEQASALGDVGDIVLWDPTQYIAIEKGGLRRAISVDYLFSTDETAFRFVIRNNGQPTWKSALTPYKDTSKTQSCVVTLAERA